MSKLVSINEYRHDNFVVIPSRVSMDQYIEQIEQCVRIDGYEVGGIKCDWYRHKYTNYIYVYLHDPFSDDLVLTVLSADFRLKEGDPDNDNVMDNSCMGKVLNA